MNTEIYIENSRLDISADISSLITFGLDDIKDFSSRSTSWSKTIILPGTANNNKVFGHIFQIGQSNQFVPANDNVGYNFNASKSADCIIFQDQVQTFIGVLRLMQINISSGRIEYEVSVFGTLAGLNVKLSSGFLDQLDFSAYNQIFSAANIIASWDNPGGSGLYYPLIDYGQYSVDKKDWDIRTFRPALYVKEYIDKMFENAGYRYSSVLFNTTRFKKLIVPNNQKKLVAISSKALDVSYSGSGQQLTDPSASINFLLPNVLTLGDFVTSDNRTYSYNGASTISGMFKVNINGTFRYQQANPIEFNLKVSLFTSVGVEEYYFNNNNYNLQNFNVNLSKTLSLNTGDIVRVQASGVDANGDTYDLIALGISLSFDSAGLLPVSINPGDSLKINDTLPKNIRQIDFLVSIVKLFNLYVYEDRFDKNLIYITPYIDFYGTNSSNSVDWSYKLNRDKVLQIKPMSEINAKKYEFKYKQDSDYYNDLYAKRYGQGYGSYVFDSQFEFSEQTKSFEIIFSATPLVGYLGEDKVISTILKLSNGIEEQIDSNIRILQSKKISGVTSWDILNNGTPIANTTSYGYAGHFDDPDAPSNDLNFGALKELFFVLVSGNLMDTQFNVYWSSYMAEITDKDSKLVSGSFYLNTKDIVDLDFSRFIYLDGVLFRLVKIEDYNMSTPAECKVDLLKVNFLIY